jgi:gamma-glutamyl phosphate reductase
LRPTPRPQRSRAGLPPRCSTLGLDERRIAGLLASLAEIAAFEDLVGGPRRRRPAGFTLQKVRTPIGAVLLSGPA